MFNVFKGTLLALMREKAIFIWSLAFPIILSTMFVFMFSNLDASGAFSPIRAAVVADARYGNAPAFSAMIEALSEPGESQMLDVTYVASEEEAARLMRDTAVGESSYNGGRNAGVVGYFAVNAEGEPSVHVRGGTVPDSADNVNQSILKAIADNYVRGRSLVEDVAREDPAALASRLGVGEKLWKATLRGWYIPEKVLVFKLALLLGMRGEDITALMRACECSYNFEDARDVVVKYLFDYRIFNEEMIGRAFDEYHVRRIL